MQNIVPPCNYRVEGIAEIWALDHEDFRFLDFNGLYDNCTVSAIKRTGDFILIHASDGAKYDAPLQSGIYSHSLQTFIGGLSGETSAALHLASKRRLIPVFKTKAGTFHSFGYEGGAVLTYSTHTNDGVGYLLTITASSIYPLFEVKGMEDELYGRAKWVLETGEWEDLNKWTTNGIWKTK